MAEETSQEKTEQPTARKLEKAREDGDVARSKELAMATIMIGSSLLALVMGGSMIFSLAQTLSDGLTIDRSTVFDAQSSPMQFVRLLADGMAAIVPILLATLVLSLITPALMGGWIFSAKAFRPKLSKLSLMKGFSRMFGIKALVELSKAIAKFLIVGGIGLAVIYLNSDSLMKMGVQSVETALIESGRVLAWSFFLMCLSLVLIAAIDVPFEAHQYIKKLKMTLQEVKDELKEVEGRPEVKAAIRQKQRELSMRRMLESVPNADVVIVNPDHYSVALSYDRNSEEAPRVVAKGVDHMAERIKLIARENQIEIVSLPVLARAIYYTTELNDEIPEPLYLAVAQVLSYVFALNDEIYNKSDLATPNPEVPSEYQYDQDGNQLIN